MKGKKDIKKEKASTTTKLKLLYACISVYLIKFKLQITVREGTRTIAMS